MKKFMKMVIVSAFLALFSFGASAQGCVQAPIINGTGYQGGNRCWGGQPQNGGQFVQGGSNQYWQQSLARQAIRVPYGQAVPQGYCSWGGRIENMAVAGLIGAVVGVIAGDNRESARAGAALGAGIGMFVPCETLRQANVARQEGVSGGNTTVVPAKCDFGDGVVVYTYEGKQGCDKIAAKMSKKVPSSQQEQSSSDEPVRAVVQASRKAVNGVDMWKWRDGRASVSNPATCVVEKLTGEGKPPFCSELKTLARVDGETRLQWALRAEKL